MVNAQLYTRLNNGLDMPLLGLGVYDMHGPEAVTAIICALETGYRLIDTAAIYRNEAEVGQALRQSGLPRHQVFVTTKVSNAQQGYDQTLRAFDESLRRLGTDYVDLYLVHWPLKATRRATWQALEHLYDQKVLRAIGVANYLEPFLDELATYAQVVPALNQVEFSPYLYLESLLRRSQTDGTVLQAYTPLARGRRLDDPKLVALARQYGKTPAQIILRWLVQQGVSAIPKSVTPKRIRENFGIFDFSLAAADCQLINGFHENLRVVDDPLPLL
ncbi:MAG: aldo/keto reductase [Bernardetiaceae bacterium]|jgi:diketogulonate reductase-like aldo/keto reductase|nr:aldo/keto reductase [Bernardetiaceae bacterium]